MDAARSGEMSAPRPTAPAFFADYAERLRKILQSSDWTGVTRLAEALADCWRGGKQVFICGNGGSAGNAIHLANDFLHGGSKKFGSGLRGTALPANPALLTCLANRVGYESHLSIQLAVPAGPAPWLQSL